MLLRAVLLLVVATLLTACKETPAPLSQQAYIWQRAWPVPLRDQLAAQKIGLSGWRVLTAEYAGGRWQTARPDWASLAANGLPVTLVIRIEGSGAERPEASAVLAQWEKARNAARLSGLLAARMVALEIDHDCASGRLASYTTWLQGLRDALHAHGTQLAITALPSWLSSRQALINLLAQTDSHVLQVHAVSRPGAGLWNARQTEAWLHDWAAVSPGPFALALPTYGSAVRLSQTGELLEVQSSAPLAVRLWPAGTQTMELAADPVELAQFLLRLRADHPAKLQALYWFRLPLPQERRSFSPATWQLLRSDPQGLVQASEQARLRWRGRADDGNRGDVLHWELVNESTVDLRVPTRLRLPDACQQVFAMFGNESLSRTLLALNADMQLLRSGETLPVAVARCPDLPAAQADQLISWRQEP